MTVAHELSLACRAKRATAVLAMVAAAAAAGGCGRKADTDPPVATPAFAVNKARAPLGSPVEVTYRFTVAEGKSFDQDYRVMVHFLDADEELMWTDDHDPPTPTSKWQPGQTIEYTRTMFVPLYPYNGTAVVHMGLYSRQDGRRLPLAGENTGQRGYKVGTIDLLPRSENIFLVFKDGWQPEEVATDNAAVTWQWTKREATLSFRNPRKDATFYLHFDGRPEFFTPASQRVLVTIGDQVIDDYALTTRDEIIRKVPVGAAQFGGGDTVDLTIKVEPSFVPALMPAANSKDPRELGIRVFHAFVEPR
jgi:hypothetical protein